MARSGISPYGTPNSAPLGVAYRQQPTNAPTSNLGPLRRPARPGQFPSELAVTPLPWPCAARHYHDLDGLRRDWHYAGEHGPQLVVMTSPVRLGSVAASGPGPVLDFIKDFSRLLRTCSDRRDENAGMSDFLVVIGIVLFAVVMLALIKGLERV
jgi:hypothetical protein